MRAAIEPNRYTPMQIRRVGEKDYNLVRELRLAALRDAPDSFADLVEETENMPTEYWVGLTKSLCNEHVMFILEDNGEPVGSTYGLRDQDDKTIGRVAGMWVASSSRGRGFGKALLREVLS